jgi:superfamily I DNA and RNA helicase
LQQIRFTKDLKRIIWAYDELQNLSETTTPPPEDLFGRDAQWHPWIQLSDIPGQPQQDIILPVCYRNTPWALTFAHALGFGINRPEGPVQDFDEPGLSEQVGYELVNGALEPGRDVVLRRRADASPAYFKDLVNTEEAVSTGTFDNELEQAEWLAERIGSPTVSGTPPCEGQVCNCGGVHWFRGKCILLSDPLRWSAIAGVVRFCWRQCGRASPLLLLLPFRH